MHRVKMAYYRFYKACLMEIEQTAPPLETNANAKFHMSENVAYQCMENGGEKHATLTRLWLTVCVVYNAETKSRT